ncbi:MAG: agmatinase [Proteobacteria bacterium]|nr:agmatinase [Pseudomonadota bacterium]
MDREKLKQLRKTYADADGSEFFSEKFQHVAEKCRANPRSNSKPYSGIATFIDLPFNEDFSELDVAFIGVPMDLGVTNRPGARFGPRAVRDVERIGPYHYALDEVPQAVLKAADIGDVPFRSRYSLNNSIEDIEGFYTKIVAANVKPISIGGDHSVTYPIMLALGAVEPVGMLHIDAHHDTGGPFDGEKFFHGGPFRQAVLSGVLDPDRCIQIGIRGPAETSGEFAYASGMTVLHIEDVERMGVDAIIEKARQVLGDKPFYISIDVDGIDPAYTPGTGTPEVGGLTPLQVQMILRGMQGLNLVGGDVVEVAPQYDPTTNTAQVAAQLVFEIFTLMAFCKT